jgi:hypothetical protein
MPFTNLDYCRQADFLSQYQQTSVAHAKKKKNNNNNNKKDKSTSELENS